MRHTAVCLLLLTITVAACDFDLGIFGGGEPPSLTNLEVGPGLTPEYSWEGATIYSLRVRRLNESTGAFETLVWELEAITATAGEYWESPIVHGEPPDNAMEVVRVEPVLTAGARYEVSIVAPGGSHADVSTFARFVIP